MSPRLTKPGMRSANLLDKTHPKTGEAIVPLGYLKNGQAVWPVLGASSDDPDDPKYTGQDDDVDEDDEDEDEEDDSEEDDKPSKKSTRKPSKDDDEDDDDEGDARLHKASQQAKRYRLALRAKERETEELKARLQAIEDEDKSPDEVAARQITELKSQNASLIENARVMTAQLAFFKANTIDWADASDAFALAERSGLFDDIVDEDGNVDERELRRGLRDLAKRKPHLVKQEDSSKARGRKPSDKDEDEQDDKDDEQGSRQSSGSKLNGKRKGQTGTADRAALAKKFPILNNF
jgi:hypothetical protein